MHASVSWAQIFILRASTSRGTRIDAVTEEKDKPCLHETHIVWAREQIN